MEIKKNSIIYEVRELKKSWKLIRKFENGTFNIIIEKNDIKTIDELKEFLNNISL